MAVSRRESQYQPFRVRSSGVIAFRCGPSVVRKRIRYRCIISICPICSDRGLAALGRGSATSIQLPAGGGSPPRCRPVGAGPLTVEDCAGAGRSSGGRCTPVSREGKYVQYIGTYVRASRPRTRITDGVLHPYRCNGRRSESLNDRPRRSPLPVRRSPGPASRCPVGRGYSHDPGSGRDHPAAFPLLAP